jgi:RNA polymerase sigma-70 factor (ECF subfamily)
MNAARQDNQPMKSELDSILILQTSPAELSQDEEMALIKSAQADPTEFARVYQQYIRPVYRYFYSRTGQAAEAEDLTAQTFLEAMEGLSRYRSNGPFAAWLFTIARRRAIDHFRRHKPQIAMNEEQKDISPDPLAEVIGREEASQLTGLISGLKPADQELLRLRFAAGLGFAEIARLVGRREAAVKMGLYRLLRRLESELEKSHE